MSQKEEVIDFNQEQYDIISDHFHDLTPELIEIVQRKQELIANLFNSLPESTGKTRLLFFFHIMGNQWKQQLESKTNLDENVIKTALYKFTLVHQHVLKLQDEENYSSN